MSTWINRFRSTTDGAVLAEFPCTCDPMGSQHEILVMGKLLEMPDGVEIEEPEYVEPRVERITNAPAAYDGFRTRTVEMLPWVARSGKQYRRVSIVAEHLDWQSMRNSSGGFQTLEQSTFDEWVAYKLVEPVARTPNP